jgi:phage terminase Nu1 subunit (DNA packaging protein)
MAENETIKITDETEISTTELAKVLGVTARRVQQMAQDGTITPVHRGKFHLCDSVQQYIKFLSKEKDNSPQEKERQDAEVSIKKAKAIVAVLEAKELQGKMHRSEDVAAMTEDLIYTIRGMLLALPGRLAVDVANTSTPAEAAETIRKEVYKIMEELSHYEYDPKKYEERVRERRSWDIEGGDAYDIEE